MPHEGNVDGAMNDTAMTMLRMVMQKLQEIMSDMAGAIGYGMEEPVGSAAKSEGGKMNMEELEKQVVGLVKDLEGLGKATKEFIAGLTEGDPDPEVPESVMKGIQDLIKEIPKKEDIRAIVEECVKEAMAAKV